MGGRVFHSIAHFFCILVCNGACSVVYSCWYFKWFWVVVAFCYLCRLILCHWLTIMQKIFTPQLTFFVIALCFGAWIVVLIPPFQSPDEINHFCKAAHVADGHYEAERSETQRLGGTIDGAVIEYATFFKGRALHFTDTLRQQSEMITWNNNRQFTDFANTAFYMPFGYIPQAIGVKIGQCVDSQVFTAFYLARMFNFLVWLILVFRAIRFMPFGKWILVGTALLPASLAFHSSCNPDALVHGAAFFTMAYSLRLCKQGIAFSGQQVGIAFMLTTFLTVQKIIFFPFVLFFYFNKKVFYKILIVNVLLLVCVYFYNKNVFITYDNYNPEYRQSQTLNEGVNPTAQFEYVLHHPLLFVQMVAESFLKGAPSTMAHFVGVYGWSAHYLPTWEIFLLFLALFFIVIHEPISLTVQQKTIFFGVLVLFVSGFSIVMYMLWCPVGTPILTNLQGRYFIGIAPVLLMLVNVVYQYTTSKINFSPKLHFHPLALMPIWIMANIHLLLSIVEAWR